MHLADAGDGAGDPDQVVLRPDADRFGRASLRVEQGGLVGGDESSIASTCARNASLAARVGADQSSFMNPSIR
ncbi:hypothetical protein [Gordonia aichiensis]